MRMTRLLLCSASLMTLSACGMPYSGLWSDGFSQMEVPSLWRAPMAKDVQAQADAAQGVENEHAPQSITPDQGSDVIAALDRDALQGWWKGFHDPALDALVDKALTDSPDRAIAAARIAEARGLRRTARAGLMPNITGAISEGREDNGVYGAHDVSSAGFDASFEIDLFGKNRLTSKARDANVRALVAQYHDASVTLIAEISRVYAEYRAYGKQVQIAQDNLKLQQETLSLIKTQQSLGEAPQLDVERAENLVNTTKASIVEFERLSDASRLSLGALVGAMPADISQIIAAEKVADVLAAVPGADITPLLLMPADVIVQRPDVQAAWAGLSAQGALADAQAADYFPTLTLSGFFGVAESALMSSTTIWDVAIGAAVSVLDFGRLEGQVDAARAREKQAFETYRRIVLSAVAEVETALSDYAHIHTRREALADAFINADRALSLSRDLYNEGEVSFLDVLDAQRTRNAANSALITAELAQAQSLIRLYKAFGIY